jgi:hypothetical protein
MRLIFRDTMKPLRFPLTSLLVLGFARPCHAQIFPFSNLAESDNGASAFDVPVDRLASDFITDGTPWKITSITADMGNSSGVVTHTVTFSIFRDDGSGRPGSLVSLFDTPASIPTGSSGLFTATSPGITLQANTPYWLVGQVNQVTLGTASWRFTLSQDNTGPFSTLPGTQTLFSPNSGGNWLDGGAANQLFRLEGTPIPEPQTWFALLVTLGAFGTLRWWTNRKAS